MDDSDYSTYRPETASIASIGLRSRAQNFGYGVGAGYGPRGAGRPFMANDLI